MGRITHLLSVGLTAFPSTATWDFGKSTSQPLIRLSKSSDLTGNRRSHPTGFIMIDSQDSILDAA